MSRPRVRYTLIVGVLIICAVAAGVWFLVLSPRMSQSSDIAAQSDQMGVSNATLQARYHSSVKQAADAPALAAQAQAEFSKMPQSADLPAVITQLTDAARSAGVTADNIEVISTGLPLPVVTAGADLEIDRRRLAVLEENRHRLAELARGGRLHKRASAGDDVASSELEPVATEPATAASGI